MESIQLKHIYPSTIGLITTNQCTAACKDCCFGCHQQNKEVLTDELIYNCIEQAINHFPDLKVIVITGGECFLLGERLYHIVDLINSHGLKSRIVTNAFWATSFRKAYNIIHRLHNHGLTEINVSTGDEHLKWVPYENIINTIIASVINKLPITINVESSTSKEFKSIDITTDIRIQKYLNSGFINIVNGHWVSFSKDNPNAISSTKHLIGDNLKRCTSIFTTLSLIPNGSVIGCCGLTSQNHDSLILGNLKNSRINEVIESSFDDFIKIWIYTEGPYSIMKFCNSVNDNLPPLNENLHICEYCNIIFTNLEYYSTLKKHYKKKLATVLSKYIILSRRNNKILNK